MIRVILPGSKEDRGQVERTVSSAGELSGAVLRETLDPLGSWTKVESWVLFALVLRYLRRGVVLARHSRRQRVRSRSQTGSNKEGPNRVGW